MAKQAYREQDYILASPSRTGNSGSGSNAVIRVIPGDPLPEGTEILTPHSRTCDTERAEYLAHLHRCHDLGYIDQPESAVRETAIQQAKTRAVLAQLISDLPPLPDPRQREQEKKMHRAGRGIRAFARWVSRHDDEAHFMYPLFAVMLTWGIVLVTLGIRYASSHKHLSAPAGAFGNALPVATGLLLITGTLLWCVFWSAKKYNWT